MDERIKSLASLMARLPGLGPKSSKRIVLYLIKEKEREMLKIINAMQDLYKNIRKCIVCANLDCNSPCSICSSSTRDKSTICVVEETTDLWAIERSGVYNGVYHILGGALSILDGLTPDTLNIDTLLQRIEQQKTKEIIIATNSTIDGQTTGQYIAHLFKGHDIKISFLAHGMPIGSEIDYLDDGTLNIAFSNRKQFELDDE